MTIPEAQQLMEKLIKYRNKFEITKSPEDHKRYRKQETLCVEKFRYLVMMKVSRYKSFNNYEDLMQEGLAALINAFNNYDPKKGIFFWWAHKYIDTRISRCANLHTTIRFPLKYAKAVTPHRESGLPVLIDHGFGPHDILEQNEMLHAVSKNFDHLPGDHKKVMQMIFGMNGEAPQSIAQVCQRLKMTRPACTRILDQVISTLRRNTQI